MREAKYRGQRIDNKEWVYGFLDYNPVECGFVIHVVGDIPPTWNEPGGDIYSERFSVITETIGQLTGLKDKSRTDIYEGDIVICKYQKRAKIIWVPEFACFATETIDEIVQGELMFCLADVNECIGNIYDNPELIKQ